MTFIILKNGLYINDISLPNLKIKQLYIKWNEKLDISIKESVIVKDNDQLDTKIDYKNIYKTINKLPYFYNFIERINLEKIIFNEISASFKYASKEDGYINLTSPTLLLKSSFNFEDNLLNIKIKKFYDKKRDIDIDGNVVLDGKNHNTTASLGINIHNDIYAKLLIYTNKNKLYYRANSLKDIKDITYTMKLLNLHEDVKYWAYEAIDFSSISINKIHGWVDFNDIDNAYKNIYAHAIGKNLNYTYNKNLDSIHTKSTSVEFKDGILNIRPKQHYTYNSKLDKSWLKIDFTKKEELLSLYLLFDGKLDKDTLGILKEYKIDVPFLQNSGSTKTNLTLKVNLRTIDVSARGDFFSKKANFRFHGFDIDVFDAYILLDNYDVKINKMIAKYQDIISTGVDVKFNAKKGYGNIDFNINKIDFKEVEIFLNTKDTPLKAKYTISSKGDNISLSNSSWKVKNHSIDVAKISLPFNLDTLKVDIPATFVNSKNVSSAYVSGLVDFKKIKFDLNIDLLKLSSNGVELTQSNTPLLFSYDESFYLKSEKRINFKLNSMDSFINKTVLKFNANELALDESYINIGNIIKTKFSAKYIHKKNQGYVQTRKLRIKTKEFGPIYANKEKIRFDISKNDDNLIINSTDLDLSFSHKVGMWKVNINSLTSLYENSKLLHKYNVKSGNVSIYKKDDKNHLDFNANIIYPYKLLVKDNIEIDKYFVQGKIDNHSKIVSFNINDNVDVIIDEDIDISMSDIGINTNAIIDIVTDLNKENTDANDMIDTTIKATNSYLYISKDRHIISEEINLQYYKNILTSQLKYKDGTARLKYEKSNFYAYGENFNDEFMENLFALSRFKDGTFDFSMSGTLKKYDGIFTMNNTVVIDYKILNNVLAFINTIPSLVTFSLPGYSSKGLKVKTAYMKFISQDDTFNISDIYLDSKEIDILGRGDASFKDDNINLELNLKTDIGSSLSKIPIIGYLLVDEDSVSTTLSITGNLTDPTIKSLLAKEIAVAPLNILYRALTLPYHLIIGDDANKTKEKE